MYAFQYNADSTLLVPNSKTLSATGAVVMPIFRVTGTVRVVRLRGIVTTVLNSAITAASWELYDQTAHVPITSAAGTTLSAAPVGSVLSKTGLAAAAMTLTSSAAGALVEPAVLGENTIDSSFKITQKTGGINTDIQFLFTKDAGASSGVIQFFAVWRPESADGNLVAL